MTQTAVRSSLLKGPHKKTGWAGTRYLQSTRELVRECSMRIECVGACQKEHQGREKVHLL